jgi:hypothetical protein
MANKFQRREAPTFVWMRCVTCNTSNTATGDGENRQGAFEKFMSEHEEIHAPKCPVVEAEKKTSDPHKSCNSLLNSMNPEYV